LPAEPAAAPFPPAPGPAVVGSSALAQATENIDAINTLEHRISFR
jgi:hypothetical protein